MKKEDEVIVDELEDEVDDLEELDDEFEEEDDMTPKPKKKGKKKKSWIGRAVDFGKSTCKKIAPAAKEFAKGVAHGTGVVATLGVAALAVVKLAGASGGTRTDADDQGYLSGPEAVEMAQTDPISNQSADQTDEIEDAEIISETETE